MILPGLLRSESVQARGRDLKSFHPEDPAAWWTAWGGYESTAGEVVDASVALRTSTVYLGLRLLSDAAGCLPLNVHRRRKSGGSDVATDHPVQELLHDEPNEEMAAGNWRSALVIQRALYGAGYSEIERNGFDQPAQLHLIHAGRVSFRREWGAVLASGRRPRSRLVYDVTGEYWNATLPAREILHFPNITLDGLHGIGLLDVAPEAIGLTRVIEKFTSRFFRNYSMPSGYLSYAGRFKDPEASKKRIRATWEQTQGDENLGRIAVMEDGVKFEATGIAPDSGQSIETREFQVVDVSRFLGIPPPLLHALERATLRNLEGLVRLFLKFGLNPILKNFEQEFNRKLFTNRDFFVKHNADALARGELLDRYQAHAIALMHGFLNRDEVRELEDRGPVEGGDIFHTPFNLRPEPVQATGVDTLRPVADAAIRRCVDRECLILKQEAQRKDFQKWFPKFLGRQKSFVVEAMLPWFEAFQKLTARDLNVGDLANEYATTIIEGLRLVEKNPEQFLATGEKDRAVEMHEILQRITEDQ